MSHFSAVSCLTFSTYFAVPLSLADLVLCLTTGFSLVGQDAMGSAASSEERVHSGTRKPPEAIGSGSQSVERQPSAQQHFPHGYRWAHCKAGNCCGRSHRFARTRMPNEPQKKNYNMALRATSIINAALNEMNANMNF